MEQDINALQKIVNTIADLASETVNNLQDGKISKLELMGYVDDVVPMVNAFMGTKEAIEEIRDGVSFEEREQLLAGLKQHFDIENDELEEKVEAILDASLSIMEAAFDIVAAIKAIRA